MSPKPLFLTTALALIAFAGAAEPARADADAGRKKASACRTCHGLDGIARIPIAPHLAGENAIYLITQLKAFKSGKREHEMMSVIAKSLSDDDMRDIAEWYASIKITAEMPAGSKQE